VAAARVVLHPPVTVGFALSASVSLALVWVLNGRGLAGSERNT
jgi:hypothetical protein